MESTVSHQMLNSVSTLGKTFCHICTCYQFVHDRLLETDRYNANTREGRCLGTEILIQHILIEM